MILPLILPTRVLDETNLVVALTIYGVAVMARSAADALASVDATTIDASTAIGYSAGSRASGGSSCRWPARCCWPASASCRSAPSRWSRSASSSARATSACLFREGKQRGILEEVIVGIVMSLLIALVFDVIIVLIGRLLMPWSRSGQVIEPKPQRAAASPAWAGGVV